MSSPKQQELACVFGSFTTCPPWAQIRCRRKQRFEEVVRIQSFLEVVRIKGSKSSLQEVVRTKRFEGVVRNQSFEEVVCAAPTVAESFQEIVHIKGSKK